MGDKTMLEAIEEQILFFEGLNVGWVVNLGVIGSINSGNMTEEPLPDVMINERLQSKWGI
jgi:hypothetical protein